VLEALVSALAEPPRELDFRRRLDALARKRLNGLDTRLRCHQLLPFFFMRYIHPSSPTRRKLSIHMDSQIKPTEDPVARAKVLMETLAGKSVVVPEEEWQQLMASQPSVEAVQTFASECINGLICESMWIESLRRVGDEGWMYRIKTSITSCLVVCLHGESSRFWTAIGDGYYDFDRREWSIPA
jgi:hypothetical protein